MATMLKEIEIQVLIDYIWIVMSEVCDIIFTCTGAKVVRG